MLSSVQKTTHLGHRKISIIHSLLLVIWARQSTLSGVVTNGDQKSRKLSAFYVRTYAWKLWYSLDDDTKKISISRTSSQWRRRQIVATPAHHSPWRRTHRDDDLLRQVFPIPDSMPIQEGNAERSYCRWRKSTTMERHGRILCIGYKITTTDKFGTYQGRLRYCDTRCWIPLIFLRKFCRKRTMSKVHTVDTNRSVGRAEFLAMRSWWRNSWFWNVPRSSLAKACFAICI